MELMQNATGISNTSANVAAPPLPNPHAYYSLTTLRASFRIAPQLSERLEQAKTEKRLGDSFRKHFK